MTTKHIWLAIALAIGCQNSTPKTQQLEHLKDSAGFPVPSDRQNDRIVFPLHGSLRTASPYYGSRPIALSRSGSVAQFSLTLTNKNR